MLQTQGIEVFTLNAVQYR